MLLWEKCLLSYRDLIIVHISNFDNFLNGGSHTIFLLPSSIVVWSNVPPVNLILNGSMTKLVYKNENP